MCFEWWKSYEPCCLQWAGDGENGGGEGWGQPGSWSRGLCRTLHFVLTESDGKPWRAHEWVNGRRQEGSWKPRESQSGCGPGAELLCPPQHIPAPRTEWPEEHAGILGTHSFSAQTPPPLNVPKMVILPEGEGECVSSPETRALTQKQSEALGF